MKIINNNNTAKSLTVGKKEGETGEFKRMP